MTFSHYLWIVRAELRKVFTRASGISALVVALLVGIVAAMMLDRLAHADNVQVMDRTLADMVSKSAVSAGGWALWARNFFLQPMFLILATATSVASEHGDRTMREVLVRPVPRWAVLSSRVVALTGLSAACLALTFVGSMALGVPMFGFPESADPTAPTLLGLCAGYVTALASDIALITLTVALSLFVRSTGLVLAGMVMALMADFGVYWAMFALSKLQIAWATAIVPFTLYSSLHGWQGYESGWDVQPFVMLVLYTAAAAAVALGRFARLDVP